MNKLDCSIISIISLKIKLVIKKKNKIEKGKIYNSHTKRVKIKLNELHKSFA